MPSIVVPTYKEAMNLEPLAEEVDRVLRRFDIPYELLIVDDNSPDDTVMTVRALSATFPVRLIQPVGRERDLSLSVLDGIRSARFDEIVVMDADLSHPPDKIPDMLDALHGGDSVFVVGSRYAPGGKFDRDWSLWRFLNSYIATRLARPLVKCSDPMSGFFALDRRVLGDLSTLRPLGYKIGLELMVRGGFRDIREVPIRFRDREKGESKMTLNEQAKYLRHLRRLYLHRFGGPAQFIHFGAVGASGFVVDVCFYYLFQWFGLNHQIARALSFWPAVSWNWMLNRVSTFGDRTRRPRMRQWIEFACFSLVGFCFNWGTYVLLTGNIGYFNRYRLLALVAGVGVGSLFNFTASTLFVYSDKRDRQKDRRAREGNG